MEQELTTALIRHKAAFGIDLNEGDLQRLASYYSLILEHNDLLHLVGPCTPEEFATRHILESLILIEHLPLNAKLADIGAGAGLPSVPCLLIRPDLRAVMIESKEKKAGFLRTVLAKCEFGTRAEVVGTQFSEIKKPNISHVTCRALDKYTQKLPQILKWSGNCTLLLYGGGSLRDELTANGVKFREKRMPLSEQRYLFYTS